MSVVVDTSLIAIVAAVASIASVIFTYVRYTSKQAERLATLETKMELIWNYIDDNLGKILHSPHTPEIDALIEKKPPNLTLPEIQKLKCLLFEQYSNESNVEKHFAYGLYLARLDSLMLNKLTNK